MFLARAPGLQVFRRARHPDRMVAEQDIPEQAQRQDKQIKTQEDWVACDNRLGVLTESRETGEEHQ
jgi:hypothetical protein